ncbi:MAG: D-alanine--D-alanine ligase family protein [Spirochaetota bacterium]
MIIEVLHTDLGKNPTEDDLDTLIQVESVSKTLEELGHNVVKAGCTNDTQLIISSLKKIEPQIVFNLMEPLHGEGQFIHIAPAVLDHLKMPYTGCPSEAIYITSNKLLAKKLMKMTDIPTPNWSTDGSLALPEPGIVLKDMQLILKSTWEHASIGIDAESVVRVSTPEELRMLLEQRNASSGGLYYAEEYIEGREFNLSILAKPDGVEVLPPAEMKFIEFPENHPKVLGYRAKWVEESMEYMKTQRCFEFNTEDQPLLESLKTLALRCWEIFGLNGYARVDFRVDTDNKPYVLEINANPCISPESGFIAAAEMANLSYSDVIERILNAPIIPYKPQVWGLRLI